MQRERERESEIERERERRTERSLVPQSPFPVVNERGREEKFQMGCLSDISGREEGHPLTLAFGLWPLNIGLPWDLCTSVLMTISGSFPGCVFTTDLLFSVLPVA